MTNSASVFLPHVSGRRFSNSKFRFSYDPALESPCFRRFNELSHDLLAHLQAEIIHFEVCVQLGHNWAKVWGKMELLMTKFVQIFMKLNFEPLIMKVE